MADSKKEDIIRRCQGMRMTVDAGYNLKGMRLTGNMCKGMFNSLGQIILDAEEMQKTIEDQEERIAIMSEGKDEEKIHRLQRELRNCRNELCLKCGLYHRAHEGVCNGCRYRHAGERSDDIRDGDHG